jgi:hypothetical protein
MSFNYLSNNRLNLNSNEVYLIQLLNRMYNNNHQMMETLHASNTEIRSMIQTILNNNMRQPNVRTINQPRTQRNTHVRFPTNANTNTTNTTNTSNRTTNQTLSSLLLDGFLTSDNLSYVFDYTIEPTTGGFQNFLDPVQIYPTETEIANATSVVRYGDIEEPLNQSCPISLDPFHVDDQVTAIKHCGHIFKTDEIQSWFESNVRCPVCRYDIRNYVQPISSRTTEDRETTRPTQQPSQQPTQQQRAPRTTANTTTNTNRRQYRILPRGETYDHGLNTQIDHLITNFLNGTFYMDSSGNSL